MAKYDFSLVLDGVSELTEELMEALYESGCTDGTVSKQYGHIVVTFSREAHSLKDAVLSAIRDVEQAKVGARVVRVDQCDLVTLGEIARRIGRPRKVVEGYTTGRRGPGGFPAPACFFRDEIPLWYWCDVALWLRENNIIGEQQLRDAQELAAINRMLELREQRAQAPELTKEIEQALLAS